MGGRKYSPKTGSFLPNRRVGIVVVYFKDNFSHNITKCQQQSVRLCLQSGETKKKKNLIDISILKCLPS